MKDIINILLTNMVIIKDMIAKYEQVLEKYDSFLTMLTKVSAAKNDEITQKFVLDIYVDIFAKTLLLIDDIISDSENFYDLHNEVGLVLSLKTSENPEKYISEWNSKVFLRGNASDYAECENNFLYYSDENIHSYLYEIEDSAEQDPWEQIFSEQNVPFSLDISSLKGL